MEQFANGFWFTAGAVAALMCVFAVAAVCEFVAKMLHDSGRREIRNALTDNVAAFCVLSEKFAASHVANGYWCETCGELHTRCGCPPATGLSK
jgi:hypothetical protein